MSLLDRIRRMWGSPPDHPLDARERDEDREMTADDERARALESLAADGFDPDDPTRH